MEHLKVTFLILSLLVSASSFSSMVEEKLNITPKARDFMSRSHDEKRVYTHCLKEPELTSPPPPHPCCSVLLLLVRRRSAAY
jgi:hypothetical protein